MQGLHENEPLSLAEKANLVLVVGVYHATEFLRAVWKVIKR